MIKYLGSKRILVPYIVDLVSCLPDCRTVLDVFSGTARVAHALKRTGFFVYANDHNAYAYTLALCYIQADAQKWREPALELIERLQKVRRRRGYFTETFCVQSRFFKPENGARVDSIRNRIERLRLPPELKAIALVSLMEAADRVDSTTGLQMAYLKKWAPRANNPIELRLPEILPGEGKATREDAETLVEQVETDVAYIDPPYNQHSYLNNYHIWESLVLWDKPEVYGVACKREDCRIRKSRFNSRRTMAETFRNVIERVRARHLIVSFNNEGFLTRDELESMLGEKGYVHCIPVDYKRYVGAQIGIYNAAGERVGKVSHLRNQEYLFVVSKDREAIERVGGQVTPRYPAPFALHDRLSPLRG